MVNFIIMFLGGIAIFIYGITNLSIHLRAVSGSRFKTLIVKVVDNPILAILIGALVTAVIGSSSAILILIIGLVRARFITSRQSVGLIMGANIGSTFSAFIVSLPVGNYSYAMLVVGILLLFSKNNKVKNTGGIILNLGLLFLGLNVMGDGVLPLIQTEFATNLFYRFSEVSFLGTASGFLFGTTFTAIIQSSSAASAIVQKLYSLNDPLNSIVTISLRGALPMIIGANIGTTITGLFASLGGNEESKRAALIHIIFNVVGALIFLIGIQPYYLLIQTIENTFLTQYSMVTIAIAHLIQNVTTTLILFFFINQIVKLTERLIPYKNGKTVEIVFDEKIIKQSPLIALDLSKKGIDNLTNLVYSYFQLTKGYSFINNSKDFIEANNFELNIDELDGQIHNYLIKINRGGIVGKEIKNITKLLDITRNLERIGDHLTNVVEFFNTRYEANHELSEPAQEELHEIYKVLNEMFELVNQSIYSNFKFLPYKVKRLEAIIDNLEQQSRTNYIQRLKDGKFDFYQTSNYSDILSDLERIGDLLNNIANVIIDEVPIKVESTGLKNIN